VRLRQPRRERLRRAAARPHEERERRERERDGDDQREAREIGDVPVPADRREIGRRQQQPAAVPPAERGSRHECGKRGSAVGDGAERLVDPEAEADVTGAGDLERGEAGRARDADDESEQRAPR